MSSTAGRTTSKWPVRTQQRFERHRGADGDRADHVHLRVRWTAAHRIEADPTADEIADFQSCAIHERHDPVRRRHAACRIRNYVSTRSPNYHVLLQMPLVVPPITINVPAGSGKELFDPRTDAYYADIDLGFFESVLPSVVAPVHPPSTTLPMLISSNVFLASGVDCCVYGFHGAYKAPGNPSIVTYAYANFVTRNLTSSLARHRHLDDQPRSRRVGQRPLSPQPSTSLHPAGRLERLLLQSPGSRRPSGGTEPSRLHDRSQQQDVGSDRRGRHLLVRPQRSLQQNKTGAIRTTGFSRARRPSARGSRPVSAEPTECVPSR